MKKYLIPLMILIITFSMFTSCDTQVYHTVTIDYDIDWLPLFRITVKEGDIIYPPMSPADEERVFVGWKNGNGEDFDFTAPVTSDVTVKAIWYPKNSTVILKDTSGNIIKKDTAKYGSDYTLPTNLGYTIASCTDDDGNSVTDSVRVTKPTMILTITKGTYTEYSIGDIGPGGGYIMYDVDKPSDNYTTMINIGTSSELGWRYIEIASEDLTDMYAFGYYRSSDNGENSYVNAEDDEHKKIGSGKTNTASLIEKIGTGAYLSETGSDKGVYAALAATQYDGGGYSDWFLPSADEVFHLMKNLADINKGNISKDTKYWTSTEVNAVNASSANFVSGAGGYHDSRSEKYLVRPFRYF